MLRVDQELFVPNLRWLHAILFETTLDMKSLKLLAKQETKLIYLSHNAAFLSQELHPAFLTAGQQSADNWDRHYVSMQNISNCLDCSYYVQLRKKNKIQLPYFQNVLLKISLLSNYHRNHLHSSKSSPGIIYISDFN